MAKAGKKGKKSPSSTQPSIHIASLGSDGAVIKGEELTREQAVERRQQGDNSLFAGAISRTIDIWRKGSKGRRLVTWRRSRDTRRMPKRDQRHCHIVNRQIAPRKDTHSMKLISGNRQMSDHQMKFFTADLYIRYNSPDDDIADQAEAEWEREVEEYNKHLTTLPLRENIKKLSTRCFHDALLLDQSTYAVYPALTRYSITPHTNILLQDAQDITLLSYVSADVFILDPDPKWNQESRPSGVKLWLYDEIDLSEDEPGKFMHRILWSDGTVFTIRFLDVASVVSVRFFPGRIETSDGNKRDHSLAATGDT